jgi:cold shock CspA family protein
MDRPGEGVAGFAGTVEWYDAESGVGEIRPDDGSGPCTIRAETLRECGIDSLAPGDRVRFALCETDDPRTIADLSLIRAVERWENEGGATSADRPVIDD